MHVCVFCGMSSACVSRSVIFLQSDIGIFSAKQCIGHSRDERGKAAQSHVIYLQFFETVVYLSCFDGIRFSL